MSQSGWRGWASEWFWISTCFALAWENSRHFATLPLGPTGFPVKWRPRNEWEIPYWERVTTQFWVVLLIGWRKFSTRHDQPQALPRWTPRQNVYACARLSISGLFFSHTFQSKSPARFILCAACDSVVLLYAARVFDYFVVIEIAFMDNQAQITETISRLDSE